MKLLILRGSSQYVNPSFYNVQEIGLAKVLAKRGWTVRIISSGNHPSIITPVKGVEWVECKRVGISKNLGWPDGALRRIYEFGPDIIQVQDMLTPSTILAAVAQVQLRVPLVLSMGEYPDGRITRNAARRILATMMKQRYSAVLCKTTASATYCKKLRLPQVTVCPVGIDPEAYAPPEEREDLTWLNAIRERRARGKRILCHVGRLDKFDNISFLMRVLKHLPVQYELVIAGEPREHGQRIAEQLGVLERVTFVGTVPNRLIGAVFENSMASLCCSPFEPFGLAAVESLFYRCPVFAHPTGGLLDIISDGYNGFHIFERSPEVWARHIHRKVEDDTLNEVRTRLAKGTDEVTWSHRALAYENVYMNLLRVGRAVQ
jgi:glycosyltransferase involved in cell wall biosynthesis